jgi:hypothetical protein
MTDGIRMYQVCRDKRCQDRSYYQQLKLSHLSYVIQWRYDKAREIAGQIEALYVDRAAKIRRTLRQAFRQGQTTLGDKLRPTKKLVSSSPHPATSVRFRSLS